MDASSRHVERARFLASTGRMKDAEKEASLALAADPQNEEALLLLAECKIDGREFDEAVRLLFQCIHLDPDNDRPFYLLGFLHYQKNDHAQSLQFLDQAIQLNPWQSSYFGLYAYVLIEKRQYKEALQRADAGLAIYAEDLTCLNARAAAQFRLNNKEAAFETIREALHVSPENDFTHSNFGWQNLEKGSHKKALEHFREALRINPSNHHARAGFKEALKANLPTYRLMLMYSLWLSSKSKQIQWLIIIAVWGAFRVADSLSASAGMKILSYALIGVYLLFVVLSWIGNSVANLYLRVHREGKYALTDSEKHNANGVGIALVLSLLGVLMAALTGWNEAILVITVLLFSLTVPLSQLDYPLHWKGNGIREWATYALLLAGILSVLNLTGVLFGMPFFSLLPGGYGLGMLVYMWTAPIMKRRSKL